MSERTELEEQLAGEISKLRELAVRSSDPVIVAKAIAASHSGVQQLLLDRLYKGERLVEVLSLQGAHSHELQVFFRLVTRGEVVIVNDSGVLVFVDMIKGEVKGTIEEYVLPSERRVGRPFVVVGATDTSAFAPSDNDIKTLVDREQAFFKRLGLSQLALRNLSRGYDTCCDTGTTSTTYSGQPYRPDDTGQETKGDCCDSGPDDIIIA